MILENIRNELLVKLANNKDAAEQVARAISHNFDNLPPNIQNLLFKMADNKDEAKAVAEAISHNFDNLPLAMAPSC